MSHSRWRVLPRLPAGQVLNGARPLLAQLLFNRGLTGKSELESFLAADRRLCGDPFLLPGMHQAVSRVYRALLSGEAIAVYGDFDTDGITATALLVQGLSRLGGKAVPYIPHRMTEGYGVKSAALEGLRRQGIGLVITVDCGITAVPEVKKARRIGLDVVVTDHHTPLDIVPAAAAVVNPRLPGSGYTAGELAGVGVALKLLQALFTCLGKEGEAEDFLDLAALGTVADMVPLLGENRYLAAQGLKLINSAPRLGLRQIVEQSGLSRASLDAGCISWTIAPRLNAAGRLEHAMSSYRLLTTDSEPEARELAMWLETKNTERQEMTLKAFEKARERVRLKGIQPLLFVSDEDFPAGVCGLVASRLVEEFYRPAVVVRLGESASGSCSGSCRSIPDFNIIEALDQCRGLFWHYGGHAQAAGFSMPRRNIEMLESRLVDIAGRQLAGLDLRPVINIDAELTFAELGGDTFPLIQKLAPFGYGNPEPTFLSRRVGALDCRPMGNGGEHLRLKLKQANIIWDATGFGLGSHAIPPSGLLDIVYNITVDHWNGGSWLKLNLLDFAPAE